MKTAILASQNKNKIREIQAILEKYDFSVISRDEAGIPTDDIEETGTTFEENSFIKASAIIDMIAADPTLDKYKDSPVIADDSGLMVDALDGAPGVYSARYAGCHGDDEANNQKLLRELEARNVAAAVLSNKPDEFAGEIVEQLFPDYSFAAVWGKQDRFPRKPDPASVNAMLSMLGLQKDECLYIGDSDVDMLTAANAGLRKIGVSWGFRPVSELEQAGADSIAYSPSDILAKL